MPAVASSGYVFSRLTGSWLAGPADALSPLLAALKEEKVFVREVDTLGVAYHSPALLPFAEDLRAGGAAWAATHDDPLDACNHVPCGQIHKNPFVCQQSLTMCSMPCSVSASLDL